MRNRICLFLLMIFSGAASAQPALYDYPITAVPIKNVVLTDTFWLPKIKIIQDSTIQYALDKCSKEGWMESFLIAGGRMEGKVRGKMPFDDTDLYKLIESVSYSLISKHNEKVPANSNLVAFEYGPVVYCAEDIDNQNQISAMTIPEKTNLIPDSETILTDQVNIIRGSGISNGNELNFN